MNVFPRLRNFSEVPTCPRDLKYQNKTYLQSETCKNRNQPPFYTTNLIGGFSNHLSTNTLGIWTSCRGLFPSFRAWLRFKILGENQVKWDSWSHFHFHLMQISPDPSSRSFAFQTSADQSLYPSEDLIQF